MKKVIPFLLILLTFLLLGILIKKNEKQNLPKEIGSLLSILLKQDVVSDSVSNNNENADNDTSFTKTA